MKNITPTLNSQKSPNTSALRVSFGVRSVFLENACEMLREMYPRNIESLQQQY